MLFLTSQYRQIINGEFNQSIDIKLVTLYVLSLS